MKLLIVDDHAGVRKLIRQMIASGSDAVCECASGDEAVQVAASFKPDAVTMDVRMAGMSAFEAVRAIRAVHPGSRVAVVTSYDEPFLRDAAREVGAVGFFVKENLHGLKAALGLVEMAIAPRESPPETVEAKLRARIAELEAENRDLDAFAGAIAHELSGPICAIQVSAGALDDPKLLGDAEDGRQLLSDIRHGCEVLVDRMERLLLLSRAGRFPLRVEQVEMRSVIDAAWREACGKTAARRLDIQPGVMPRVQGDQVLLQLAFVNLFSNAIKFTALRERPAIAMRHRKSGDHITFTVSDNGLGFDAESAGRLFKPFQRLHTSLGIEGRGLGLATTARIIRRHNGRIWAESAVNQGAQFHISLPCQHFLPAE